MAMNYILTTQKSMETKKQNILIISVAVIISACIWFFTGRQKEPPQNVQSRVFKVMNGWGYDILVNDTIVIHQEFIPTRPNQEVFENKVQAEKTANLVLKKLRAGTPPTLTQSELQKILETP
jgi:hypothetical protein